MKFPATKFPITFVLLLLLSLPSLAQTAKPGAQDGARERAIKRCKENRGVDCESREGLREWVREERPLTDEDRQSAAGARRHREECAKNKKNATC